MHALHLGLIVAVIIVAVWTTDTDTKGRLSAASTSCFFLKGLALFPTQSRLRAGLMCTICILASAEDPTVYTVIRKLIALVGSEVSKRLAGAEELIAGPGNENGPQRSLRCTVNRYVPSCETTIACTCSVVSIMPFYNFGACR
jgi:hypothetical protein